MSKPTINIKDKLEKIKKIVFAEDTPAAFTDYKLKDGTTCSVDKMEVGGAVKIGDTPAPDGDYTLEDGSTIKVAAGLITEVVPAAAPAATNPEELKTPAQMKAALAAFAVPGTTPDMQALVTVLGACFNYCFGWDIRQAEEKAQRDAAIATYKANFAKVDKDLKAQKDANKLLFELVEAFAEESKETPIDQPADWDKMSALERRRYIRDQEAKK